MLNQTELNGYAAEGFIIKPQFLSADEVQKFRDVARDDLNRQAENEAVMKKGDKEGHVTLLRLWNHAEDDIYGLLARDERLVKMTEEILQQTVYLYSHKMTMKQPREGGAWEWHQDYGYWHNYGCLAPDMLSIWIALDESVKANGCLQVLPKSHRLGRLNHIREEDQTQVDPEYMQAAVERFELKYVEMQPGDALIFHCNLLHRSDANTSDKPRWGFICSYNAVENAPFKKVRDYGNYEGLKVVSAGSFMNSEK